MRASNCPAMSSHGFASVESVVEDVRRGRMVVVCDDEDREAEGDLTMAAELVTPEDIAFMAVHGRGLVCLPMAPGMVERLGIPDMVERNEARLGTAFTASIEAREGVTTGISAADRARTVRVAVDPSSGPGDLVMPGHIFPLRAKLGGVLQRAGHTEAAVDLARLAGLSPAGIICEVMNDDGTMARDPNLRRFAARHGLKMVSIAQIIDHRLAHERPIRRTAETRTLRPEPDQAVAAEKNGRSRRDANVETMQTEPQPGGERRV